LNERQGKGLDKKNIYTYTYTTMAKKIYEQ